MRPKREMQMAGVESSLPSSWMGSTMGAPYMTMVALVTARPACGRERCGCQQLVSGAGCILQLARVRHALLLE
jgi:hypothetical protein